MIMTQMTMIINAEIWHTGVERDQGYRLFFTRLLKKTFNDLHHHCHRDLKVTTCKGGLKEGEETVLWNTG